MRVFGKNPRIRAVAAVAAAAIGLTVSPASPVLAAPSSDADATTLRVATSGFVDSFNPFTSVYFTPTSLFRYMYENLVQYSEEDGSPVPGLAEKWESNADGTEWTYHIRQGMKWSDNEPITANDVVYTYTQMMQNEAMATANGTLVTNFDSVTAPDDNTVVIKLKEPQGYVPGTEIPVVPEHVWSKLEKPEEFMNDKDDVGSGPFVIKSYSPKETIVLERNPNFWGGAPTLERIQYIYYENSEATLQALRAGSIDVLGGLSAEEYQTLQNVDGIAVNSGVGRSYTALAINPGFHTRDGQPFGNGNPALQDVRVRQAIRQGIDAQTLLDRVANGQGVLATSFIPAAYPQWMLPKDDPAILKFDPEAAKAKLDEAGWKVGANGIREKDGQPLSLELQIDGSSSSEQSLSEFIQPWMKDIGIDLKVTATDSDTLSTNSMKGNYDMYFSGWSLSPDPDYQLGINTCMQLPTDTEGNGGTSQDGYCDPEFDKLYQQQRTELDPQKRIDIVHEMLAMHYTASSSIALYYGNSLEAYRSDRFTGFAKMPTENGVIIGQPSYYGYKDVKPVANQAAAGNAQTGLWIVIGVVAAVLVIGGIVVASRRKKSADVE